VTVAVATLSRGRLVLLQDLEQVVEAEIGVYGLDLVLVCIAFVVEFDEENIEIL